VTTRIVKIKTWKKMRNEFGLAPSGSINCEFKFLLEMEQELPANRIISVVKTDSDRDVGSAGKWGDWSVSWDMIEYAVSVNNPVKVIETWADFEAELIFARDGEQATHADQYMVSAKVLRQLADIVSSKTVISKPKGLG